MCTVEVVGSRVLLQLLKINGGWLAGLAEQLNGSIR